MSEMGKLILGRCSASMMIDMQSIREIGAYLNRPWLDVYNYCWCINVTVAGT
jgi:hypothetical protein